MVDDVLLVIFIVLRVGIPAQRYGEWCEPNRLRKPSPSQAQRREGDRG
ncbi:MAG: hypothetical protein ABSF48_05030 [Thermodesulfobacteriota bacterium]